MCSWGRGEAAWARRFSLALEEECLELVAESINQALEQTAGVTVVYDLRTEEIKLLYALIDDSAQ